MTSQNTTPPSRSTVQAWTATGLSGFAVPALMLLVLSADTTSLAATGGPIFTLGLMGVGIIGAATSRHFGAGVLMALVSLSGLVVLALLLGMPLPAHPISTVLAACIASCSFAARGALFARSLSAKGWLMGLFVVAGEASILLTAAVLPGVLPDWLLALLPAQWSSVAIQTSLTGADTFAVRWPLIALAGTAATTMITATLWPRRWPYLIMFTGWLGFSALVYWSWLAMAT